MYFRWNNLYLEDPNVCYDFFNPFTSSHLLQSSFSHTLDSDQERISHNSVLFLKHTWTRNAQKWKKGFKELVKMDEVDS